MQTKQTEFDLEKRVAEFASRAIAVCEALPNRIGAAHIKDNASIMTARKRIEQGVD